MPISIFRISNCQILITRQRSFRFHKVGRVCSETSRVHSCVAVDFLPGFDLNVYIFINGRLSVQFKVW